MDSNDAQALGHEHVEAIVRAVALALNVRRRYQFFVWTQSNLQALLPHQLAICGAYQRGTRELMFDVFNSVTIAPELAQGLANARGALMQHLQGLWLEARCKPLHIPLSELGDESLQVQREGLQRAGFTELLAHGLSRPQRPTELESFFVFAQQAGTGTPLQRHLLELLMPHIHATWLRVQSVEREITHAIDVPPTRRGHAFGITERERQILAWLREGKSNLEIGEGLGISALTVKNHVQKILRKLNAANRAQAVARAMTMKLLGPMSADVGKVS